MNSASSVSLTKQELTDVARQVNRLQLEVRTAAEQQRDAASAADTELDELRTSVTDRLKEVASLKDLAKFESIMLEYAKYEHIQTLRDEVIPKMDHFTGLMQKFEQDNLDVLVCVRRFDSALCEKANKSALITLHK